MQHCWAFAGKGQPGRIVLVSGPRISARLNREPGWRDTESRSQVRRDAATRLALVLQRKAGNRATSKLLSPTDVPAALGAAPNALSLSEYLSHRPLGPTEQSEIAADGLRSSVSEEVHDSRGRPVAVHDGPQAHQAAARIGAHAYAYRQQIVLGATGALGRAAVLEHELAHVEQMRSGLPSASQEATEEAAAKGRSDVGADEGIPHGLWWLIPVAVGVYIVLRPGVANAPTPEDVEQNRLRPSVSEVQVAGEALALFAVPGGVTSALARAGYGVITAMALGGASSAMAFRGVQDVGAGEFSGVQAYVVDAATGAVIGTVVGGTVRLFAGAGALGPAGPRPNLVHFTTRESQAAILSTTESGQAIGQLRGSTGIWALTDDALQQPMWLRAARGTIPLRSAQAPVAIPPEAAAQFSRAVPVGPVSLYQYVAGVYRAPAGAISMATGELTATSRMLPNIRGLIFPYGADAAIWFSAAAVSPPSATANERGIRSLLVPTPPAIRQAAQAHLGDPDSSRSDGPFIALSNLIGADQAIAGALGAYDPVRQVCGGPEASAGVEQPSGAPPPPMVILVAPLWPTASVATAGR